MGDLKAFSPEWMKVFQTAANRDPELSWIAKHMNCRFLWKIGCCSYLFQIEGGKIISIAEPTWNDSWDFNIEGPKEAWDKFIQPVPPPVYHDLLGIVTRIQDCCLNGNRLMAMQYMRSLTRMFTVAREMQGGGGL
ncbi:hypothetical protein [Brevibacillus massiliensis]|uniref:hypothetical protein n=1 Tax=Brevibacillus massiliensis TaxID=1118054 RepID=UPI00030328FB|nr:hypothetical protein [Brevibacillus massiliensis]